MMMTEEEVEWLATNRNLFLKANIPALDILDFLVTAKVFIPTKDDYQVITAETTLLGQIRKILDALPSKSSAAFQTFARALENLCPHVLEACTHRPNDLLQKLDEELRLHFQTIDQEELKPFGWLAEDSECPSITITNYIRHLAVVGESRAEKMISEQIASSAVERQRCEYLYSNVEKHDLVRLENIFEDLDSGRLLTCSAQNISASNVATAQAPSTRPGVAVSGQEGGGSFSKPVRWMVGIYGGAGCGKTSSVLKLYSLYARDQLWRKRFKLFLFWRLRDPKVQQSENLEQLLRALPKTPSCQRPTDLANALLASEGEGVLVVLDGVDELEARRNAFVREILDGSSLPKACVIATSRPCAAAPKVFSPLQLDFA